MNMYTKSLASIIIPIYNRSHVVSRAIESVFKQSYSNWELIIIDDGSTDGLAEVLSAFMKDRRVRYRFEENRGVSAARNEGIRISRGEYLFFLDSDDEFLPDKLEFQIAEMCKFSNSVSICGSIDIVGKREKIFPRFEDSFLFDRCCIVQKKIPISASFIAVKKNVKTFFDEELPTFEDFDFLLRAMTVREGLFIARPLVKRYRTFDNVRLSVNANYKTEGARRLIKLFEENRYNMDEKAIFSRISGLNLSLGFWLFMGKNFKDGREAVLKGLRQNRDLKRSIKYLFLYFLSFSSFVFEIIKRSGVKLWEMGMLRKR
jgi:glycosyltransferase involved in cell wall biosynthesis